MSGSCVVSSDTVVRDVLYDGHPINEKCTVILRIAPTFIRFGSFEIFKSIDRVSLCFKNYGSVTNECLI